MSWVSIVAIYFVVWWIMLFTVLPFGVRTQEEEGHVVPGTVASAPVRPMLVRKAVWTSIVSAVVVFGFWLLFDVYGLSVASLADMFLTKPQ
jgi:predicted secreted protein